MVSKNLKQKKSFLERGEKLLPLVSLFGFTLLLLNSYLIDRHSVHTGFPRGMRPKDPVGVLVDIAELIIVLSIILSGMFADNKRRSLTYLSIGCLIAVVHGVLLKAKLAYFAAPLMVYVLCAFTLVSFLKRTKNASI